jgi:hypothetical protein
LAAADEQAGHFETLGRAAQGCERSVIIKYEDMIHDFALFTGQLGRHIVLDKHVIQETYLRS